jgi:two-component system, NarL family, sensor histidine kinase UhpB
MVGEWRGLAPQVTFSLQIDTLPDQLPDPVATAAYRVVQEAVTNAVRHSNGTRIDVSISLEADRLVVRVVDNGAGLPGDWGERGRFGLAGLRERVLNLAGELDVAPASPHGVDLKATLPLATPVLQP